MTQKTSGKENKKNINPLAKIHQAHDLTFKAIMSGDLRVAQDFLTHHLPPAVKEKIDLDTLKLCNGSFVDVELAAVHSDLVFSVDFKKTATEEKTHKKKRKAFLYLLLEQETKPTVLMPWRMIVYSVRLIDRIIKETSSNVLPVVIPVVFYNGDGQYPYSVDVMDLFGDQKPLAEMFMLRKFHLIDLNTIPDEEIHQHELSGLMEFAG